MYQFPLSGLGIRPRFKNVTGAGSICLGCLGFVNPEAREILKLAQPVRSAVTGNLDSMCQCRQSPGIDDHAKMVVMRR